jgi:chromate transport protein ChrA
MISTVLLVMPPALARAAANFIPGVESFELAFHLGYGASELIVLGLIVHDRRQGAWHWPFPLLLAMLLVQQASFHFVPEWAGWQSAMRAMASAWAGG